MRAVALASFALCVTVSAPAQNDYPSLVALHEEFQKLKAPKVTTGVPDYTPAAMRTQHAALGELRKRLDAMDPRVWPVPQQVDYLVVRAQMDELDFHHRVLRPWARDPGFYVDMLRPVAFAKLPVEQEKLEGFRTGLAAVPALLKQARQNLTEGAGELADFALRNLEKHDGVGHEQPLRSVPPPGILGWFDELVYGLEKHHPELVPDGRRARQAVAEFHEWLKRERPRMTARAGIGLENYNWLLKNVRLMTYTADDIARIGDRELARTLAGLALERHRNRHLPELLPAASEAEYAMKIADADRHVREFIRTQEFLTIPDYIGEMDNNVPWIVRPGGRNFWEQVQFRDPRPDKVHAGIPGHRFDIAIHERDKRPIRGRYTDSARIEGWGFYLEEGMMNAGLLDDLPRTRELFWIFAAARAVRNRAELHMHTGEWTVEQAIDYMVKNVPFMDPDVARVDCEIYLRTPTYGMSYQMGKLQIERLLAERARQLGETFRLGEFHDQFLAAGTIPVSLIRWEITGFDDEVREFLPATSTAEARSPRTE
ncbi:MAG TPA: DUF885 family protein [Terriglobales bacterium]|nr:DUF885 family protein [Terriglobales bacterium]